MVLFDTVGNVCLSTRADISRWYAIIATHSHWVRT